jgi:trehalose 6-phosphate phosphatase
MPKPSAFEVIDTLEPAQAALFLDFDGTLVEIVERPGDVAICQRNLASLERLNTMMDGALAIVTGRDVATVDGFLSPFRFAVSGVHGFEARRPGRDIERITADLDALELVSQRLARFRDDHEGLLLEHKPASVSLHYRQRPDLGTKAQEAVAAAVAGEDGVKVLPGKMVFEVKAHAGDKGSALDGFMAAAPFRGRIAVFIGDDVTDEAAFRAVNARGGVSIKVGGGETVATHRLADPSAVMEWLEAFAGLGTCTGKLAEEL